VTVELPYGDDCLTVTIPNRYPTRVIEPNDVRPAESPARRCVQQYERRSSLHHSPTSSARDRVCVIGDGISRPTPTEVMVPALLDKLIATGAPQGQVRIVIGLGSHRPMTEAEMRIKLGRRGLRAL